MKNEDKTVSNTYLWFTSLGGTFKSFEAAMNMSGEGFRFSKASADTIASNLIWRG